MTDYNAATGTMSFSMALRSLKSGSKIYRRGWNGKGMFIFLVSEGLPHPMRPYISMKTADGTIVPWVASQTDLLANDWDEWFIPDTAPSEIEPGYGTDARGQYVDEGSSSTD